MTCVHGRDNLPDLGMARRSKSRTLKAKFPRLRRIRQEQLGWEIVDILNRLPGNKPSISSIYRLEQARPSACRARGASSTS
jgi:hypothetical protein